MNHPVSLRHPPKLIDVAFLPTFVTPESLQDRTVVVTDVLRATTTIIHALFHGCRQVLPQKSIESALATHAQVENSLLGGERGGRIIEGFHGGNSPLEYTREVIENKTLVLATTNGTVAMESCRSAQRILIGAMINLGAVARSLAPDEPLMIVCSGTDGCITSEDTLFAGALVERVLAQHAEAVDSNRSRIEQETEVLSDTAKIALSHWKETTTRIQNGESLVRLFATARGGINLVKIGLEADVAFAAKIDSVPIVPQLDPITWSITHVQAEQRTDCVASRAPQRT